MISPFQTIFIMAAIKKEYTHDVIYDISSKKQIFMLIIFLLGTIMITITTLISNFIFQKREIN